MTLRKSVLRMDKASLLETFGSLKIKNFGYTPSFLQLFRELMSNLSLLFLYSSFSYFQKSLTVTFPYFRAISLYMFIIFLYSTKLKIIWIKLLGLRSISKIAGIEKHIKKDNKSHIFKHLYSTATCFDSYNSLCFKIIDKANSKFLLKIKEALHINWRKPNLNAQQNHLALTLSLYFCFPCSFLPLLVFLSLFCVFAITSSLHNTPCNRLFNNYVINICPGQIL